MSNAPVTPIASTPAAPSGVTSTPRGATPPAAAPAAAPTQTRTVKEIGLTRRASGAIGAGANLPAATPASVTVPGSAPSAKTSSTSATSTPSAPGGSPPSPSEGSTETEATSAAPDAAALTALEEAKRMARLSRRDADIARERERLDTEKRELQAVRQRQQLIEQARQLPKGQRLGFLKQAFGWSGQDIIDDVIGDAAKTPEQIAQERSMTVEQKMSEYDRRLQEAETRLNQEREASQVNTYIANTLKPLLTKEAFPFLHHELGDDAPRQLYVEMNKIWRQTGRAPDPKELASRAEAVYKNRAASAAKLLGVNVTPAEKSQSNSSGQPSARTTSAMTQTPGDFRSRVKRVAKPYSTKPL